MSVRYHAIQRPPWPHLREAQKRSFLQVFARRAKKSWAKKLNAK